MTDSQGGEGTHILPEQPQPDPDEQLREALHEAAVVIRKLAPFCATVDELVGMIELAQVNDGQLQMLKREISPVLLRN